MQVLYASAIVVVLMWVAIRVTLPAVPVELDFDTTHGTFFLFLDKYILLVRSMIAVDLILAFTRQSEFASQVCVAGAIAGVLFCVWTLAAYERYVHQRYPRNQGPSSSNYTPNKYATTLALGCATVGFTLVGIVAVLV